MIPRWLAANLETTTGAPIGARNARPTRHRCGALTLVGLDDDLCALPATVDPIPLTPTTELAAVMTGRATYNAYHHDGRIQLFHRDRWQLRTPPSTDRLVLAEHSCGLPLGTIPQAATAHLEARDDAIPY